MMRRVLIAWVGRTDLRCGRRNAADSEPGPILRLLRHEPFDEIHLLNDIGSNELRPDELLPADFVAWLADKARISKDAVQLHDADHNLQNSYEEAFEFTRQKVREIVGRQRSGAVRYAVLLSSGYPAAQAALIIAQQTILGSDAELFVTSQQREVERVRLPFLLAVDVLPAIHHHWSEAAGIVPGGALEEIIGESGALTLAKQLAQRVSAFDQTSVLILGETGTGKELFARAIHEASPRKDGPSVAINCAAIPETLLESELFGHVKGAFTDAKSERKGKVAQADGGTLFLDEIGDMPLSLQAKLLRFLQEKEFFPVGSDQPQTADVRIISATHRDLVRHIAEGKFREDLYYRLNQVSIRLPSLRERGSDVKLLAEHFLEKWNASNKTSKKWTDEALAMLLKYPWPGNVRELEHAITRLAIFTQRDEICPEDVETWLGQPAAAPPTRLRDLSASHLLSHLAAVLDELLHRRRSGRLHPELPADNLVEHVLYPMVIGRALRSTGGNASEAGKIIRGTKLDLSNNKPDARRHKQYEHRIKLHIDERFLQRLHGRGREAQ